MSVRCPSAIGARRHPTVGKDHLNLADWRVSVATYQQQTRPDGSRVDHAEYAIRRADGTCQSVTLESPSTVGLPTAAAEDVLIALLHLAQRQQFASDVVRFVPSHLLAIMRWAATQKNYRRLGVFLKQLRALTVTYRLAWYSRKSAAVEPLLITGILAEAKLVLRRGRSAADAVPESYVQWTKHFYDSLRDGNLTDLDLDLYFGWERPGAKHLYRHLNKVWHSGRRPKPYERDLRELACGHLGMTDCKDLKRNFDRIVAELEQRGYLAPAAPVLRYRKVRPGVWRVRLELHPERIQSRKGGEGESARPAPAQSDASRLVCEYHRHRFGRAQHEPTRRELRHAEALLQQYGMESVLALLPDVARRVRERSAGDLHFGFAAPFFHTAFEARRGERRTQEREQRRAVGQAALEQTIADAKQRRAAHRARLLSQWHALPNGSRRRYRQLAIERAESDFARRRLLGCDNLADPPIELLEAMELDRDARGE